MVGKTRTCRNQTANDHVFLQTTQVVSLAHDGGFRQYSRCFLERRCRNEAVRRKRCLRNAEQNVFVRCRTFAQRSNSIVLIEHFGTFDLFTLDEVRIARIGDLDTAQHLTNNHFNVLVVDLHTLQAVNVLDFVDNVTRELFNTEQSQNVVRINGTIHHFFTLLHDLTVMNEDRLVFADECFV